MVTKVNVRFCSNESVEHCNQWVEADAKKGCGWQSRPISPASPIFEEIYICKLIIFVWFAFRNNQSNLTTVSNICKNIYFLLCAVLNFKQRIAEKILNNLCGTSFINGLVGMPYKENSKSAFKLQ